MGNSREAMCKGYIRFLPPSPGNLLLSHVLAPHVSSVFVFGGVLGGKVNHGKCPLTQKFIQWTSPEGTLHFRPSPHEVLRTQTRGDTVLLL